MCRVTVSISYKLIMVKKAIYLKILHKDLSDEFFFESAKKWNENSKWNSENLLLWVAPTWKFVTGGTAVQLRHKCLFHITQNKSTVAHLSAWVCRKLYFSMSKLTLARDQNYPSLHTSFQNSVVGRTLEKNVAERTGKRYIFRARIRSSPRSRNNIQQIVNTPNAQTF